MHGDVQGHNHHLTEDGQIIWFDFDLCGWGWRAYDIAYYYTRIPEPVRAPVIQGYESVRPLSRPAILRRTGTRPNTSDWYARPALTSLRSRIALWG